MPPVIDIDKCSSCGICVEVCSEDVFYGSEPKKPPEVNFSEECWHCGACYVECPKQAIDFYIPLPMRL